MAKVEAADLGTTRVSSGDVVLDIAALDLRRSGRRASAEPQLSGLLRNPLDHRDRVVPKEELLDHGRVMGPDSPGSSPAPRGTSVVSRSTGTGKTLDNIQRRGATMNTRTIAIAALVVAVIVLLILMF